MGSIKRHMKKTTVLAVIISTAYFLKYLAPADIQHFVQKTTNKTNPFVFKHVADKTDTKADINKTQTKDKKQTLKMVHVQDTKTMVTKPDGSKNTTSINEQSNNLLRGQDKNKLENDPDLKYFLPRMSENDRSQMLQSFDVFVRTCNRTNLTYFLWGGSLLGAYRHHGLIPWDDDFDIVMDDSDREKIRHVLSSVKGFSLLASSSRGMQWKFYMSNLSPIREQPFKWPFIDIFFFKKTSKHIVGISSSIETELKHAKEDILPVQFRLFEGRYVPVPRKMEDVVIRQFGTDTCTSLSYLHKECMSVKSRQFLAVDYIIFFHSFSEKNIKILRIFLRH